MKLVPGFSLDFLFLAPQEYASKFSAASVRATVLFSLVKNSG